MNSFSNKKKKRKSMKIFPNHKSMIFWKVFYKKNKYDNRLIITCLTSFFFIASGDKFNSFFDRGFALLIQKTILLGVKCCFLRNL